MFNSVAAMHTHIGWHKRAENIAAGKYDVSNSNGCRSHLSARLLTLSCHQSKYDHVKVIGTGLLG